ncbi:MAG: zinc ribbon domain-containing protein [Candidatus Obscuribacterales bacterium]|nr:zinc ribbon domain-containing protein [Candidatus Obscuribacterales bacterium]
MGLLDDVVQGIGKEVSRVQARGQEMMQSFNLQNQIRELEKKKTGKLLEIGRLVTDKYVKGDDVAEDVLKDKANEVAGYESEMQILQAEMDSLKVDTEVPTSKKAEKGAGFHTSPGYECPNCHAPAARDKAFCPSCGESLKKAGSSSAPSDDIVDVEPNGN